MRQYREYEHTLILKGLSVKTTIDEARAFVRNYVNGAKGLWLTDDARSEDTSFPRMMYLNFDSKESMIRERQKLTFGIEEAKKYGDKIYSRFMKVVEKGRPCFMTRSRGLKESNSAQDRSSQPTHIDIQHRDPEAQAFFETLTAKDLIEELFNRLSDDSSLNAFLICNTGTGKTVGIAIHAALTDKKVLLVLPKVIQVTMLVDFLKSKLPTTKIGYAAGREKDYDLGGSFGIIIVTYGHLLRKLMQLERNDMRGFSDYILVLDEVHESLEDIQAVMCFAPKIENQKIITSATLNVDEVSEIMAGSKFFQLQQNGSSVGGIVTKHHVKILWNPLRRSTPGYDIRQHVIKIIEEQKKLIEPNKKILVFVPSLHYVDILINDLVCKGLFEEAEIGEAHAEMWEDEILTTVRHKRVIISTNVLESSITIPHLSVVVDLLLKNALVDNNILREMRISKAEADQRAGRVGRTEPGTVIRVISQAGFDKLPDYPDPPFKLNDPHEIYLLVCTAFGVDKAASKLRLGHEQAERCRAELHRVGALIHRDSYVDEEDASSSEDGSSDDDEMSIRSANGYDVTAFGNDVANIAMPLKLACSVVSGLTLLLTDEQRALMLIVAVALSRWPSYIFVVPRAVRIGTSADQVIYVREHFGEDVIGFSPVHTLVAIFLDAFARPDIIVKNDDVGCGWDVNRSMARGWFNGKQIHTKFGVQVLCDLRLLCRSRFCRGAFGGPRMLSAFNGLRTHLRGYRADGNAEDNINAFLSNSLIHFIRFEPTRLVRAPAAEASKLSGSLRVEQSDAADMFRVPDATRPGKGEPAHVGLFDLAHGVKGSCKPAPLYAVPLVAMRRQQEGFPTFLKVHLVLSARLEFPSLFQRARTVDITTTLGDRDPYCVSLQNAADVAAALELLTLHQDGCELLVHEKLVVPLVCILSGCTIALEKKTATVTSEKFIPDSEAELLLYIQQCVASAVQHLAQDPGRAPAVLEAEAAEHLVKAVRAAVGAAMGLLRLESDERRVIQTALQDTVKHRIRALEALLLAVIAVASTVEGRAALFYKDIDSAMLDVIRALNQTGQWGDKVVAACGKVLSDLRRALATSTAAGHQIVQSNEPIHDSDRSPAAVEQDLLGPSTLFAHQKSELTQNISASTSAPASSATCCEQPLLKVSVLDHEDRAAVAPASSAPCCELDHEDRVTVASVVNSETMLDVRATIDGENLRTSATGASGFAACQQNDYPVSAGFGAVSAKSGVWTNFSSKGCAKVRPSRSDSDVMSDEFLRRLLNLKADTEDYTSNENLERSSRRQWSRGMTRDC